MLYLTFKTTILGVFPLISFDLKVINEIGVFFGEIKTMLPNRIRRYVFLSEIKSIRIIPSKHLPSSNELLANNQANTLS